MRVVGVVALVCACRSSDVTPDRAPLAEPSAELPAWFGTLGTREITGTLVDAENRPIAGRVHLSIDVPDPAIWSGIEQMTGVDGRFAFAVPRAGAYTVFATAPGVTSRVVEVDTRKANADVRVFAFACTPQPIVVQTTSGAAIASARVDIGGTITRADERGRLSVCATGRPLDAVVRASGFAAYKTKVADGAVDKPREIVLRRGIAIRGRIFDEVGRPASNVGVQPRYVDQRQMSHSYPDLELPLVVTSDADGRFVFRELGEIDQRAGEVAVYTATSFRGDDIVRHIGATFGAHAEGELVLRRERMDTKADAVMLSDLDMKPTTRKLRGRVIRQGRAVPDARIMRTEINLPSEILGYSRADGSFDLDVHDWGSRKRHTVTLTIVGAHGDRETFEYVNGDANVELELR
jgi:hypothetical protein